MNKMDLPVRLTSAEVVQMIQQHVCGDGRERGGTASFQKEYAHKLSLRTGEGLAELKAVLVEQLGVERQAAIHPTVTERHRAELVLADQSLVRGREKLSGGDASLVLAANELRRAAEALGRIIGRNYTHDLLDQILSRFCVGK